jgi:catabolite regulation protein CreA
MAVKSTPNTEHQISRRSALLSSFATALTAGMLSLPPIEVAHAADGSRTIGQISGSGLVFKDTLVVEAFDDPKVRGVTLYISNFERPLNERLQKDFFNEPSYASVTCVKTGKQIEIADNIDKSKAGEPVFEEKRSLLFKELRVQRIYDEEKQTIVYVSFNTRLDKNSDTNKSRFKTSISAISLE